MAVYARIILVLEFDLDGDGTITTQVHGGSLNIGVKHSLNHRFLYVFDKYLKTFFFLHLFS